MLISEYISMAVIYGSLGIKELVLPNMNIVDRKLVTINVTLAGTALGGMKNVVKDSTTNNAPGM